MKVKRTFTIKTEDYQIGDVIKIKLTNGEKYTATAVAYEEDGTLFLFDNLLPERKAATEIMEYLNTEFFQMLPNKLLTPMALFNNANYFVRIPTEKELFSTNKYGESEDVEQWKCMRDAKNRVCGTLRGNNTKWYWTCTPCKNATTVFVAANGSGTCDYASESRVGGIRPVIKLMPCY